MTSVAAPQGDARLLEMLHNFGRGRIDFAAHQQRYGSLPLRGYGGPGGPVPLADTVEEADIRGRGGGAFPLAVKMRAVARRDRGGAVVVANGAESEPLSDKDKLLLTRLPHLVIDGALLVADSVGADTVHLVAHEGAAYDSARAAVRERRDASKVVVQQAPDGYVASQDTALIRWLGGGPALPTFTPPLPVHSGVRGRPTVVSNVETLAHVALVARFGARWHREVGEGAVHGTTLLTLSGAVERPGVVEVPLGVSLRAVVDTAGARPDAEAVLLGGWFGSWIDARRLGEVRLDPDVLRGAGMGVGSGVVYVQDPRTCPLVYVAEATDWLAGQSAQQCGPCINGLPSISRRMRDVASGHDVAAAEADLRRWTALVVDRGACRHPDGVGRFVGTALRVFAADVDAHRRGRCRRQAVAS